MNIDALAARGVLPQAAHHQAAEAAPSSVTVAAEKAPVPGNTAPPTLEQVKAAAAQIEQFLKSSGRELNFHVDNDTGKVVVSVRDVASGDLIRQMPSEEALRLARTLTEGAKSLVELVA